MRACKNCRYVVQLDKICPKCGGELSEKFSGLLIMLDAERSQIAKAAGINTTGTYAVKVK